MARSEREALTDRFGSLREQGLVDVKFLLRNADGATVEQVCGDVNAMMDEILSERATSFTFRDSQRS